MTISGAYGRDYKSKKAIIADLAASKDFVIRSVDGPMGSCINLEDMRRANLKEVTVRYKQDRDVTVVTMKEILKAVPPSDSDKAFAPLSVGAVLNHKAR